MVAFAVALNLGLPVVCVCLRDAVHGAALMPVPEAAVDENTGVEI